MRTLALGRLVLRGSAQVARRERGEKSKQRVAEAEKWNALAAKYVILTLIIFHRFGMPGEREEVKTEFIGDFGYPPHLRSWRRLHGASE